MPAETIPILRSADFDQTASFWSAFGFVEIGRWPDCLILRHLALEIELHFWLDPGVDRWTNDVACYVRFGSPEEAVACHAGWAVVAVPSRLGWPHPRPSRGERWSSTSSTCTATWSGSAGSHPPPAEAAPGRRP